MELWDMLAEIALASIDTAAQAARARTRSRRRGVFLTLRPGPDTPMWNVLVERVRPHLRKRGTQANLARVLGVPRQRVHDYFVSGTRMPDTEKTLQVLFWLSDREQPGRIQAKPGGTQ